MNLIMKLKSMAVLILVGVATVHAGAPIQDNPDFLSANDSGKVVVAVIDTGVDYTHKDLAGSIWQSDATPFDLPSDFNDGYATLHGWDFRDNDAYPYDCLKPIATVNGNSWFAPIIEMFQSDGHGTHVAGIIKKIGVDVSIMPLRIDYRSMNFLKQVISAVEFAAKGRAKIVNMSFGFYQDDLNPPSPEDLNELARTIERHPEMLFVIAAGNENRDMVVERKVLMPAGLPLHNIVIVGAVNDDGALADFSNIGEGLVDIFAPGVDIRSTWPGNSYRLKSGTSMATPFVVGAAARIVSSRLDISGADLKSLLLGHTRKIPALFTKKEKSFINTWPIEIPVMLKSDLPRFGHYGSKQVKP